MKNLVKDERVSNIEQLRTRPHSEILELADVVGLLMSPDTGKPLLLAANQTALTDGEHSYPVVEGAPVLYPKRIAADFLRGGLDFKYYDDTLRQYFLLSQIKQRGEINSAAVSVHYQRHLFRMQDFLAHCSGTVLDVGCDNVDISASLFSDHCQYVGLDPFSSFKSNFRIVGAGEFLPFGDASIDNVVFNTSLDHILDYHLALEEAQRVLKPGGRIFISTLIWTASASLLKDAVHFHHFREYEIFGALSAMKIEAIKAYQYKNDEHRYGMYISASKRR